MLFMTSFMNLKRIFKSTEFKIFISVWIVYIFYLQIYGISCMANSQSALTAAIANEGQFEIDTYYKVSCDISYYNQHYYSGQSPGISFLAAPVYLAVKPLIYLIPDNDINFIFDKIESYGESLPIDYWGKKKLLSNYFDRLSKREILEYVLISGIFLPVFTTALISALGAALLFHVSGRFTRNFVLRLLIVLFYSFGTVLFHLSTLFFQRPIAIVLSFFAFSLLFKLRCDNPKNKKNIAILAGLFAGVSTWFDYFHIFVGGLLFLYLLSFTIIDSNKLKIRLNKNNIHLCLRYLVSFGIPILFLFSYYHIIFDDPFANSYTYRIVEESNHKISDLLNLSLPDSTSINYMLQFFINNPIVILGIFSLFIAFRRKDEFINEKLFILIFVSFTFFYSVVVSLAYPVSVAPQFFRHMTPLIPYILLMIPYFLGKHNKIISSRFKLFLIIGFLSVSINWIDTQYEGIGRVDLNEKSANFVGHFISNGPSSAYLRTASEMFGWNSFIINSIALILLAWLLYLIWNPSRNKNNFIEIF